jgi:hypothetical protein
MGFVEFIQEHRWWVLAICLPLIVIYGRVLLLAAFGAGAPPVKSSTAPVRRLPPKPVQPGGMVKPSGMTPPPEGRQEVLPSSLDAGMSGHQKAGAAKTVKLPATPPKTTEGTPIVARKPTTDQAKPATDSDAEALDGLFGRREEPAPIESPSQALRRKASRMEELGFHHGIPAAAPGTAKVEPPAPEIITAEATPAAAAAPAPAPAPAPAGAAEPSPLIPPGGTARSSTAELTSILERIDKFLAEDTPSKPAPTVPPSSATTAVVKTVNENDPAPAPAASSDTGKATEAMPRVDADEAAKPAAAKPDPHKKTQPMWARADATDEDAEPPPAEGRKPGDGQQRLF